MGRKGQVIDMKTLTRTILIALGMLLTIMAFVGIRSALAKPEPTSNQQVSSLHPTFALLDKNGENVITSGQTISTMKTCGQCHNTEFIQSHAFHSDLGLADYIPNGEINA